MRYRSVAMGLLAVVGGCRPSRPSQSAGQVGCQPDEITISDETVGHDGYWEGSENWVAECRGRRFICTESTHRHSRYNDGNALIWQDSDVSCTPEFAPAASSSSGSSAEPAVATHEPPSAGGGFQLGSSAESARGACEAAGHQWQTLSPSQAKCSGAAVSIGLQTQVELGFCSAVLCRVTLVHEPEADWLKVIADLRTKIETKYGAPGIRQGNVPEACRAADAFVACLKNRRVRLRYGWSWGSGQSITLLIGVPLDANLPAIRLTYAGAKSQGGVNESAL